MSSTIYGLASNSITPRSDFTATQDETGKWKGSQSFTIRRGDYASIKTYFYRGELLSVIYPSINPEFNGFTIESHEVSEQAGGMDIVNVTASGWTEGSETQSERETVYDYNTTLAERPIIDHPKFKALGLANEEIPLIIKFFEGKYRWSGEVTNPQFFDNYTGLPIGDITSPTILEWFNCICVRGVKTYRSLEAEYTETKTDIGGLTASLIQDLGMIDTPPNSPVAPTGKIWQFTTASETRSSTNPVTYSRAWSTIDDDVDNNLLYTP